MSRIERIPGSARGRCKSVKYNGLVWTVGTAPGADVTEQTRNLLALLEASLLEAGSDKSKILEATVYLSDMNTKSQMDAVWCDWIPDDGWPCRACVGSALYPGDLVEIKLLAALS